jgi:hypothetical protein
LKGMTAVEILSASALLHPALFEYSKY